MTAGGGARAVIVGAGEVTTSGWLPGVTVLGWPAVLIDRDHRRAEDVAARLGRRVRVARSLEEAAPTGDDVVVIATPPSTHGAAAREAIGAGARRLIIEKPPFASSADMDATMAALREHRAAARSAFIRREWSPIAEARRLFPAWRERFGPLQRVRITEGRPYGWGSRATAERGSAGLSSMFLDELPHAFDALWGIAGWKNGDPVDVRAERVTLMDVEVGVTIETGGERVELQVRGSRTELLPNALDLGFEDGSISIDMKPSGGILVRDGGTRPALIACNGASLAMEPMFASLLRAAATDPIEPWIDALEAWRGPLQIAERLEARP